MSSAADPITSLAEGMIQLHELYLSAREAGFTENQAMTIVLSIMLNPQS